jgi:ribonuclease-3
VTDPGFDPGDAVEQLSRVLGYRITDEGLVTSALTHPSYASEHPGTGDYQRLEFLGDAVLELAVTHYLYDGFPDATEGEMTLMRASVVSESALASVAHRWGIPNLVRLGRGEEATGGSDKHSILSDIVESLLGAVYLDAGFDRVEQVVHEHWRPMIDERSGTPGRTDYKTRLQEVLVAAGRDVEYVVTETGPQHAKEFTATVRSSGDDLATGTGTSKKRAEQAAAKRALER